MIFKLRALAMLSWSSCLAVNRLSWPIVLLFGWLRRGLGLSLAVQYSVLSGIFVLDRGNSIFHIRSPWFFRYAYFLYKWGFVHCNFFVDTEWMCREHTDDRCSDQTRFPRNVPPPPYRSCRHRQYFPHSRGLHSQYKVLSLIIQPQKKINETDEKSVKNRQMSIPDKYWTSLKLL